MPELDESASDYRLTFRPRYTGAINTYGACKEKCQLHKGKQRDSNSVFCKTCGIFILASFTKPRKGSGISCQCCNQRVRLKAHNSRKPYGKSQQDLDRKINLNMGLTPK